MTYTRALPPPVSRPWLVAAGVVWALSMALTAGPVERLAVGPITEVAVLVAGPFEGRFGPWALAETGYTIALLDFDDVDIPPPGAAIVFDGDSDGEPGTIAGRRHGGTIDVKTYEVVGTPRSALGGVGYEVSSYVLKRLAPFDAGRGLLAGFLMGDTNNVADSDVEAMRLSGLAHFVAVSGSNVALFLLLISLAAGPMAMGPKRRAVVGLVGLPIYAAATRFEPSVMRASVMAGIALGGRLVGLIFEAWQLLALAVIILLLSDPSSSSNVGFQLSVAATAGVLFGARWPMRQGKVRRALMITVGAQAAVAPLLLIHFGSVPLMAPLVNLIAAPIVAAATVLGAVGMVGPGFLVAIGGFLAEVVLWLARVFAGFPQLGVPAFLGVVGVGLVVARRPSLLSHVALATALLFAFSQVVPPQSLPVGSVVVLDVGQGDAILVHGGSGRFALIDGGPDEALLRAKLRSYGVRLLELVVLSHVHADHATGLSGVVGTMEIGEIWEATKPHQSAAADRFLEVSAELPRRTPSVGERWELGVLDLLVLGPKRRYASPNDQSIVILVEGPTRSMLLTGDIEKVAQAELEGLEAEVLKVPHQGGATSEAEWLTAVGADVAVISVGPNQFGHPEPWVVETLDAAGADVVRTDEVGDVVIDLS